MPCSTKIGVGIPAGIAAVASFVCLILGIVVLASGIPTSECGPKRAPQTTWSGNKEIGVTEQEKSDIDAAFMWIAWPLMIGGLLGIVGGVLSVFGGIKATKGGICGGAALTGTASAFVIGGALFALLFAAVFGHLCDDYECGTVDTCQSSWGGSSLFQSDCAAADVCCSGCNAICEETKDWACGLKATKGAATAFGILGSIFLLIASSCGCAGSCCCPGQFNEFAAAAGPAGPSPGMVIGQPVGAAGGVDNMK